MRIQNILLAAAAAIGLAACETDLQRGVGGAAIGAVAADAVGGNALVGAAVGGAAGVVCDDVGICR